MNLFYLFCSPSFTFRYKAIVNPMDIQTSNAVLWTCMKAIAIWIVSILLAVPEAVFSELVHISDADNVNFTECIRYSHKDNLHPRIHSVIILLVYLLIPLIIISIYYYHIAQTLIKSAHNLPGEYSEYSKRQVSNSDVCKELYFKSVSHISQIWIKVRYLKICYLLLLWYTYWYFNFCHILGDICYHQTISIRLSYLRIYNLHY